ncbi:interferon regulatory factor 7 isoform X1 [Podarcis lilfordi]|uniref:Interferon regulatory factor 7 isoform X1 n=1 Tax=Podarcis lilfordi TaxID=74358 RepID=A0AA35NVL8_9SAUR|nr:interferon regulatory factor 7 isoform X1 [Podarcis lilfordi]
MAAPANERGRQKVRFFDWLINEINSGRYKESVAWTDDTHTTFRILWKHNSRKNLVASDYKIFQAWAMVSGKYNEGEPNPAKWKTNFRCALNSTKRFEEVESEYPDYHVYRIIPRSRNSTSPVNPPADTINGSNHEVDQLHMSPCSEGSPALHQSTPQQEIDDVFKSLSLENTCQDVLQWVLQQAGMDEVSQVSWAPVPEHPLGEALYNNNFIEHVFLNEEPQGNGVMNNLSRNDCHLFPNQQAMVEQNTFAPPIAPSPLEQPPLHAAPLQNNAGCAPLNLDVSIYYRGKLLHEAGVEFNSCMFTYNPYYEIGGNPQIQHVLFPNPEILPDQKQVNHTLTLLKNAGLLLYQKNNKICAWRIGRCKVFWAFSKELEHTAPRPPLRLLGREEETDIFNYERFCQELRAFRDGQRCSSPDYTIYLCFGQSFASDKPKESKLILVKLVPMVCKQWHEDLQRQGYSSLNSENLSLQLSNSLFEMIEQLTTMMEMD